MAFSYPRTFIYFPSATMIPQNLLQYFFVMELLCGRFLICVSNSRFIADFDLFSLSAIFRIGLPSI